MAVLVRSHLGAVSGPSAPFDEAAERLADEGSIRLNDGVLTIDVSEREAREILSDLFTPVRVGDERAFASALGKAVAELSDLQIEAD